MQTIWQDLRYGARMLRKQRGFTFIAALTLAMGIGVNTAIFSAVSSLLLRPSPYAQPERLAIVFTGAKQQPSVYDDFSYLNYLDYRDRNQSFGGLIAYRMTSAAISNTSGGSDDRAEVVWGETVSGNYFDVLGAPPALGRGFRLEEDRTPNTHPVVVLGHSLWLRRFNADPALVGRSVYLNGHPFTVIGVAPERFTGTKFALRMEFWVPLMMRARMNINDAWRTDRSRQSLGLMGRLKPGVNIAQAEADLSLIAQELEKSYPQANEGRKVQVVTEREGRANEAFPVMRLSSLLAFGVVGLVLLIACVNVANLLLARGAARSREIGVRLSLGAGRGRIVRQLLTESLLLSLLGGALGLLLSYWSADLLNATIPPMPYVVDLNFAPDRLTLFWATGVSLLTSVIFGLSPALSASRVDLVAVVKSSGVSGSGARRMGPRNLLVVAQLAVSVVVLVCAGLFLRSLRNAQTADVGFNVENLVSMQLDPELLGYNAEEGKRFYAELGRRVAALPGVSSATVAHILPLTDNGWSTGPLIKEGEAPPPPNQGLYVHYSSIGVRYFETMGTRLLLGRDFTEHDGADAPQVVIVNLELARRLYGGAENAIGKRFLLSDSSPAPFEIVGVAADGKYRNIYENPRPYMFLPHQQFYISQATLTARAQSSGALQSVAEGMRREAQRLDTRLPVFDVRMAEQHMSWAYWGPKLGAGLSLVSGLLALALATMGLYGVMSYAVSRRTKEIGVRMALGAQPRDALRLIVRQGMLLVAIGLACGFVAALALGRVLTGLLLGVGSADPLTFAGVIALLALTAFISCLIPARRAAKVDPMVALRFE
ncbi:MAG TPA: ABC transporter permease [Blastocatellia bacterium]|nr:ABC transporter permease [Blastocatellia bacterium]